MRQVHCRLWSALEPAPAFAAEGSFGGVLRRTGRHDALVTGRFCGAGGSAWSRAAPKSTFHRHKAAARDQIVTKYPMLVGLCHGPVVTAISPSQATNAADGCHFTATAGSFLPCSQAIALTGSGTNMTAPEAAVARKAVHWPALCAIAA